MPQFNHIDNRIMEEPLRISRKEIGHSSRKNNSAREHDSPELGDGDRRLSKPFTARSNSLAYRIDDEEFDDDSQFGVSNLDLKM